MRVFHFILGKADKNRANGVNQVVAGLAKYSARAGIEVRIIGKANSAAYEGETVEGDGFNVVVYSRWSGRLKKAVREAVAWADVVHLHGTYAPHNVWVGWLCNAASKPYIVTTHAGLSSKRKALKGRFRKTLYHLLVQRKHLEQAALVHALTEEEASENLAVIKPRNMVVIPNGIDLEDFPSTFVRDYPISNRPIRIGYIGRISQEKNLPALCTAFKALNKNSGNFELLLAGPLPRGDFITRDCSGAGIRLVGPRFGPDKLNFLNDIDLMVLPSLSEGFPVSAAEALALGVPIVITRTSNLTYFFNSDAFFLCEATAFGLEKGLRNSLDRRLEWAAMVQRGRALVEAQLNWTAVSAELVEEYRKMARTKI